ncbi:hypothetical protein D3C78_1463250 [compost metagenome]
MQVHETVTDVLRGAKGIAVQALLEAQGIVEEALVMNAGVFHMGIRKPQGIAFSLQRMPHEPPLEHLSCAVGEKLATLHVGHRPWQQGVSGLFANEISGEHAVKVFNAGRQGVSQGHGALLYFFDGTERHADLRAEKVGVGFALDGPLIGQELLLHWQ